VLLSAAIASEVAATTALTYSNGLTRHTVTVVTAALYVVSYICLAKALKAGVEVSTAYAVWSGIGTVALAVIGASLFGEAVTPRKVAAILLIIGGVTLLHLTSPGPATVPPQAQTTSTRGAQPPDSVAPAPTRRAEP
jgi:small multidrug resistance pump